MAGKLLERCAVITGDVVKSSKLPDGLRRRLPDILRIAYADLRSMAPDPFPEGTLRYPLSVFRGDAFQMVAVDPAVAVHVAVALRAIVLTASERHRIELRMAVGIGSIDFIPRNDLHEGDGEAFRLSGRALDEMSDSCTLVVRCVDHAAPALLPAVSALIAAVIDGWTSSQARAVVGAMSGLTQAKIAESWPGGPVLQQTAGRHLRRAHWEAVREALECTQGALE